jgi:predicted pyridoxine 5'-phosphate oxidase superfamily flavin-nucleotide-binding protein
MSQSFADIAYTRSVRAAQQHYGSREAERYREPHTGQINSLYEGLTAAEASFISERDSFYQSTVSDSGWPYVQHRGGPTGFLKVIDRRTIAYADFGGNRQYVSVGNLGFNHRIALIMTDYASRQRLKIFGIARIVDKEVNPELLSQLTTPAYRARIERAIIIEVQASDWNCPQHITRRFTEQQLDEMLAPLLEEKGALHSEK